MPNRYDLGKTLLESDCDVAFQHLNNLAMLTVLKNSKDCPGANKLASSVLLLPTYPCFSEKSARKIVRRINEYIDACS